MLKKILFSSTIFTLIGLFSCNPEGLDNRLLPEATGQPGELFIVMDSIQWKGELGNAIRNSTLTYVPGLPQEEPYFKIHYIEPTKFKSFLKQVTNILFVATLDSKTKGGVTVRNYITRKYIEDNPDKFRISQQDVYARNQSVLHLFSATEAELVNRINQNQEFVRDFFNKVEKDRLVNKLYKSGEKKGIEDVLVNKHHFYMRIPNGYRLEENDSNFVWIRQPGTADGTIDKNIFVSSAVYSREEIFNKSEIIAWRNRITRNKIYENPEMVGSYMETDTIHVKVAYKTLKLGGNFAKEIRGIWKTHTYGIGGPYIGYAVLDKNSNTVFYIDGFVVSPGKPKRESMRELEAIISTFRTEEQALQQNQKHVNKK